MNKKNEGLGAAGAVVAVGAAVAAASAAAYLLFGKEAKSNRKAVKGWIVKMKGEIIEKLEKANQLSEPTYNQIIDTVSARYGKLKDIDQTELAAIIADIKKHWKVIAKGAKPKSKSRAKSKSKPKTMKKAK